MEDRNPTINIWKGFDFMKKIVNILVLGGLIMEIITMILGIAHNYAMYFTLVTGFAMWIIGAVIDDKLTWNKFNND